MYMYNIFYLNMFDVSYISIKYSNNKLKEAMITTILAFK